MISIPHALAHRAAERPDDTACTLPSGVPATPAVAGEEHQLKRPFQGRSEGRAS